MNKAPKGSGRVSYKLNGAVEVTFNPEDPAFVERLYSTIDELNRLQARHFDGGADHFLHTVRRMREILDSLFDVPICEPLFGGIRPGALAEGAPLWRNLLHAVISQAGIKKAITSVSEGGYKEDE